jgi:hypothetical protein
MLGSDGLLAFWVFASTGVMTTPGSASYSSLAFGSSASAALCAFTAASASFVDIPSLTPTTSRNPAFAAILAVASGVPNSDDGCGGS